MGFVFEWLAGLRPAGYLTSALLFAGIGILAPIAYILVRRAVRRRYFNRFNRRTFELRQR